MKRYTIGFVVGVLLTVIVMKAIDNPIGRFTHLDGPNIMDTKTGYVYKLSDEEEGILTAKIYSKLNLAK
tara:strand:- start:553 stop:759 length:207 start_codon:yes stop_codon:yes gene_type:complete